MKKYTRTLLFITSLVSITFIYLNQDIKKSYPDYLHKKTFSEYIVVADRMYEAADYLKVTRTRL